MSWMTSSPTLFATCMVMYSVLLARAAKWKKQKKKSLIRLPPDDDSLRQHIKRANFLAYIQRHPVRRHPSPIGHGWELVISAVDQYGTQNLLFPFHFQSPHRRWMAMILTLRLILTLKPILTSEAESEASIVLDESD